MIRIVCGTRADLDLALYEVASSGEEVLEGDDDEVTLEFAEPTLVDP